MEYVSTQPVYLPACDFLNLEFHLMDTRPGVKPDAFVSELVKRWLALEMERLDLRKNGQPMRGFQWKNVFLPDGTNLRTSYRDTVEFAKWRAFRESEDARQSPRKGAQCVALCLAALPR